MGGYRFFALICSNGTRSEKGIYSMFYYHIVLQLNPRDVFAMADAADLDELSVAEWARKNCYTQTMADCIDVASQATLGMESKR